MDNNVPRPTPEQFGWHTQVGFDDEPSGWMYEEGEERYYEALAEWEKNQKTLSDHQLK
jgi:hypothetical protein